MVPLVSDVLLTSATLLNDSAQASFTNAVLFPYLKIAWDELREILEEHNIEITNAVSDALSIVVGVVDIGGNTGPPLPQNLVEIQALHERTSGTSEDYILMVKRTTLPKVVTLTNQLVWWAYEGQKIKFVGANVDRQVKIDYISNGLPDLEAVSSPITLINAKTALEFRTAGLAAEFIGENPTRADSLNNNASGALERALNINIKSEQSIITRRRPFRANYIRRGFGGR